MTESADDRVQGAALDRGSLERVRLLLVDDHRVLLDTLSAAFDAQDDLHVVGAASSVSEALILAARVRPGVVLLDLRLQGEDSIEYVQRFRALDSRPAVLILSATHDHRHATRAIEAGASGYLTKQQPFHELLAAVRSVARGEAAIDPSLLLGLLNQRSSADAQRLTKKEHEVLELLALGYDAPRIGAKMFIAVNTVRNHVQRILTKLGATSRLEAVAIARREGLLGHD